MNCQRCGAPVDGKAFYSQCGTPVAQAGGQQPQQRLGNPTAVLVLGILSLAAGCLFGLVFGIIGLLQANRYIQTYGPVSKQVRIGKMLSTGGIVYDALVLLFVTVFVTVYVIDRNTFA